MHVINHQRPTAHYAVINTTPLNRRYDMSHWSVISVQNKAQQQQHVNKTKERNKPVYLSCTDHLKSEVVSAVLLTLIVA